MQLLELPTEILELILDYARLEVPSHFGYFEEMNSREKSFARTLQLSLICHTFRKLIIRHIYAECLVEFFKDCEVFESEKTTPDAPKLNQYYAEVYISMPTGGPPLVLSLKKKWKIKVGLDAYKNYGHLVKSLEVNDRVAPWKGVSKPSQPQQRMLNLLTPILSNFNNLTKIGFCYEESPPRISVGSFLDGVATALSTCLSLKHMDFELKKNLEGDVSKESLMRFQEHYGPVSLGPCAQLESIYFSLLFETGWHLPMCIFLGLGKVLHYSMEKLKKMRVDCWIFYIYNAGFESFSMLGLNKEDLRNQTRRFWMLPALESLTLSDCGFSLGVFEEHMGNSMGRVQELDAGYLSIELKELFEKFPNVRVLKLRLSRVGEGLCILETVRDNKTDDMALEELHLTNTGGEAMHKILEKYSMDNNGRIVRGTGGKLTAILPV
ncbi:hypothetical protein TWF694_006534 [Orbilia ellipsospora]|uniref:F-box domain-containing protein n=1 Tax=Orbilia ellipsospora TaxID=2528407 RepID=A0AAV9XKH9_9PEZI